MKMIIKDIKKLKLGKGDILCFDSRKICEKDAEEIAKFLKVRAIFLPELDAIRVLTLPKTLAPNQ